MFTRRSRKGRIHVVRERVHKGYRRLSDGLGEANRNVQGGIWQVHKGLQLGLAKGHQAIQSGLKGVQDITGDFNMYQRNSYYQYQEPVAMFNMGDVKYQGGNQIASFAQKALPGSGKTSAGSAKSRWQRASRGVSEGVKSAGRGVYTTGMGAAKAVGRTAAGGADWTGRRMGEAAYKLGQSGDNVFGKAGKKAFGAISGNPRLAGGLALGALAAGAAAAGGTMFMRRRRSKNGKMIVENVRR